MDERGDAPIRSTCPYCGVGCGVLLRPDGRGGLAVEGDPDHPANKGRLCSKGLALGETVGTEGRLLSPRIGGEPADWDTALDHVATRFSETISEHGPDSVAFYVSGQLLTEDYYVANKLMKGFIGSGNIDTNSRLCMASTVAGHRRAFGTDTVPGIYDDIEEADLVVLVGSNLAWCHPVLYQRLAAARKARGTCVVVIDPRRTATCDIADLHLPLNPGTDVALFNGLFGYLREVGALDKRFILDHTTGFDETFVAAASDDPEVTGLPAADIERFYRLFAATERTVTVFSQGVNQSVQGTDKVNAILNCHLATGRIGKPGAGPFSVTGQPNAMGGRETGGLANMLAAHLDIENASHRAAVRDFWSAPRLTETQGLKAVDMFRAVRDGRIKALWIACTNPAVSMPDAHIVAEAIRNCDFVVVNEMFPDTDTARLANVLLPAAGWGEKDGTVSNSDRTISRQRPALPQPGGARADWAIFSEVGQRMGWKSAFDYAGPAEIFREHAALSGVAARLGRDFDISALAGLTDADYDYMAPVRWPISTTRSGGRFFGDGRFFTSSGRARLMPVRQGELAARDTPRFPFRLLTGRIRDQWHTMTRSTRAPRLNRHQAEPFLQIHPVDAEDLGLFPADLVRVQSPGGASGIFRVFVSTDVSRGTLFAPIHWTGETAPSSRIGPLIASNTDPVSGQPESKAAVVSIRKYEAVWYAFAVSVSDFRPKVEYWSKVRSGAGWRAELAGEKMPVNWTNFARELFGIDAEPEVFQDSTRNTTRLAFSLDGRMVAALFVTRGPVEVARDFIISRLGEPSEDLLAARPGAGKPDPGPVVCACMNVGRNTLLAAIAEGGDIERICGATGAGTNCGSCRPEIADMIARFAVREAAE